MYETLLNREQLDGLLVGFLARIFKSYSLPVYSLFELLYQHGFRIRELANLHTWTYLDADTIVAKTLKGSNDRLIDKSELSDLVVQSIADGVNYVYTLNYPAYVRLFERNKGVLSMLLVKKQLRTHAFRHNYFKRLDFNGASTETIRTITGVKNDAIVLNYVHSVITAKSIAVL